LDVGSGSYWKLKLEVEVTRSIKKGENVNHEDFDDVKKIKPWIMSVVIKKGKNVDHALF